MEKLKESRVMAILENAIAKELSNNQHQITTRVKLISANSNEEQKILKLLNHYNNYLSLSFASAIVKSLISLDLIEKDAISDDEPGIEMASALMENFTSI